MRSNRATDSVSSPATTRSRITSACSRGSPASRAIAAAVLRFSMAVSAESTLLGNCAAVTSSSAVSGRRERCLARSIARRLAVVNSHARQACSSPRNDASPRTTCTQVSAAMSSSAPGAITRR